MSATLGGLIKDLRLQKNISQLEIAFALGWKEPSRLSRIEQGKNSSPPRFLIENIMDAMKLTEEERYHLLMAGNYMPTDEEIEKARKKIIPYLKTWLFPAFAIDYTWRVIAVNQKMYKLLHIDTKIQKEIETNLPNLLELAFSTHLFINHAETEEEKEARDHFLLVLTVHFIDSHRTRTRERWYLDLMKKMMNNKLFRELWKEALSHLEGTTDFMNFGDKSLFINEKGKKKRLSLNFFDVPLFHNHCYWVEYYVPSDLETFKYFLKNII